MLGLAKPSIKYKHSFLQADREFMNDNMKPVRPESDFSKYPELYTDFKTYVNKVNARSGGKNLPKGFVPDTTYWLVDGGKYIGSLSIRHRLTKHLKQIGGHIGYKIRPSERKKGYGTEILKLGLRKAKQLGLKKILLTCDYNNGPSRRIIEKNGGMLENRVRHKLRFWIKIK